MHDLRRHDELWAPLHAGVMRCAAVLAVVGLALVAVGLSARPSAALPLYARQTGLPCAACHTAFPELTPFGRRFKLGGYTLDGGDWKGPPFAVALQPAFTHTADKQPGGAAPGFGPNDNFALQQASLFTGGRIFDGLGAFIQATYDGVGNRIGWDNTDIRFAHSADLAGHPLLWGLTLNNNPTVQDVWNTTPAWRFPYISSSLAPTPANSTLIEGPLAQQVLGLGAYGFLDDKYYLELSGYRTLSQHTQEALGVDTTGESAIDGVAPYWRAAFEPIIGNNAIEVGTFGLHADVAPMRMFGAGTDSVTDIGIDTQYQYLREKDAVTARLSWIHEDRELPASQALGLATNSHDWLNSFNGSVTYTFGNTWSLTGGYFMLTGSNDPLEFGTVNGSPNSNGLIGEIAYLPFMHGGPSFWPWLNMRIGLQYTYYDKFDGAASNIDGMGRSARSNNTVFLYTWIMF
jgi:hypothetical protein